MTDIVEQARRRTETLEALSLVDVPPQDKASMSWQVESVLAMRQAVRDNVTMANEIEHLRFSLSEARATGRREGMEAIIAIAEDYANDAMPESEYRRACADITEAARAALKEMGE